MKKLTKKYRSTIPSTGWVCHTILDRIVDNLIPKIDNISQDIENYKKSGQESYLKDAVELYVNTITIINKELRSLKYKVQEMLHNKDNDTYRLVQKSYTLSDLQIIEPNTENKVISFSV